MKTKKPPASAGGGQAQGGVTLARRARPFVSARARGLELAAPSARARRWGRTHACTRDTGIGGYARSRRQRSPPNGAGGCGGSVVVVGEVRRATAGLGGRWAHVICDLASRPGWWVVRYTASGPGGWMGISHGVTDDLTAPIVSYSRANSVMRGGCYGARHAL
eukprot:scaffold8324_cov45-Phaeocystis_antarctica.AAC.2